MAVVLSSFACVRTGRTYTAGQVVPDDDAAIPGREAFFDLGEHAGRPGRVRVAVDEPVPDEPSMGPRRGRVPKSG